MNPIKTPYITVPLGREAHAIAEQFAIEQDTPRKGKKVYLNTLAVYAVHSYLKWLAYETDLNQSDSWHPALQPLSDVADLVLPGIGKLECRPVLPGETSFLIPSEATVDRMGYVAVQFSENLDEVQLLGFIRTVSAAKVSQEIAIANLQPLEILLDYIPDHINNPSVRTTSTIPVNLSRWLENIFEAGWQTAETLFSTQAPHPAFSIGTVREIVPNKKAPHVRRGKLIDLGIQLADKLVVLMITLTPASDEEVNIRLQVYPTGEQIYLPPNLQLMVLDEETNAPFTDLQVTARSEDNCIQLEFSGQPGEGFSIKLALGDVSLIEDFVI